MYHAYTVHSLIADLLLPMGWHLFLVADVVSCPGNQVRANPDSPVLVQAKFDPGPVSEGIETKPAAVSPSAIEECDDEFDFVIKRHCPVPRSLVAEYLSLLQLAVPCRSLACTVLKISLYHKFSIDLV